MNDSPSASSPSARVSIAWLPPACAGALALLHFVWVLAHFAPAIMSPDANGYVVQARLLVTEGRTSLHTDSPAQFVGMHWLETGDSLFQSRYPAGLPVLFAVAWKLGGLRAALLVNPLLASLTVLLTFFLARRWVDGWPALLAAAVVATNATAQQHALDADAHTAAAFFLTAGVLLLLQFADDLAPLRGLLAGLCLGIVPTVRYPEAIAGVAVGAWLLWRVRPLGRVWPAVVGAAAPLGLLMIHNAAAYGAPWRTGYALTGEQTGFGWSYFTAHALSYLQSLGGSGLGLFFAFGLAGLAGLAADVRHRAAGVLLAGIVVPLVLLYMAYYFGAGDGNLRFLVPTFPLLAATGVWLLARATAALGPAGRAVWIAVAVVQLTAGGVAAMQTATRVRTSLAAATQTRELLEKQAPAGSILIVEHQLGESLDATGEWRLVEENMVGASGGGLGGGRGPGGGLMGAGGRGAPMGGAGGRGGRGPGAGLAGGGPDQPSPQQANKNRVQQARYDGLSAADRRARVWADIRTWAAGKPVYWLARSADAVEAALPAGAKLETVAEVDAPGMAMMPGGGGRGMGGGLMGPGGRGGGPMGGGFGRGGMGLGPGGGPPPRFNPAGGDEGNLPGAAEGADGGFGAGAPNQKLQLVRIVFAST
jgi:4-amino-4-deoxy-L-arabinose transferase-like glycosyltransferase